MNKQIIKDMMVLTNAIARVRELHKPDEKNYCLECRVKVMENRKAMYQLTIYPCPTIEALDGKQ